MQRKALILGIGGQDGSYLADILLEKEYEVHGMYRRSSVDNLRRVRHSHDRLHLHRGDLADPGSVDRILAAVEPDEIYNEADQDHVGWSTDTPSYSADITAGAVQRLLEAVLEHCPKARVFQPLSATMFGPSEPPQNHDTPFSPRTPYAVAKVCAWYWCEYYRDQGVWVATGTMFNHDSPRRGPDYLLQRIVKQAQAVAFGHQENIEMDRLDLRVDIGYAREFMEAAYLAVQEAIPDDWIIGTGVSRTVLHLCEWALKLMDVDPRQVVDIKSGRFDDEPEFIMDPEIEGPGGWVAKTYSPGLVGLLIEGEE